jgi:hypothetical protein
VQRVAVLQYGDDPVIEPGELLVRVFIEAAEGCEGQEQAFRAFEGAHGLRSSSSCTICQPRFRRPGGWSSRTSSDTGDGPRMVFGGRSRGSLEARALEGGDLTPVMARLGRVGLETLDALITAGIASSRAGAVRWALARIRERPAYAQLRERAREIDRLKTEFSPGTGTAWIP